MKTEICAMDDCHSPITDIFGVECECGLCMDCCNKICTDDMCDCTDNLLSIRFDFEFETETEMHTYAQNLGKVVLTEHTKPIIKEEF